MRVASAHSRGSQTPLERPLQPVPQLLGWYRSCQIQRTICQPRSRSASSRRFSAKTASAAVCPGLSSRPYFSLPSNSPSVRNSSQPKSARPTRRPSFQHLVLRDRARHANLIKDHPAIRLAGAFTSSIQEAHRTARLKHASPADASPSNFGQLLQGEAQSECSITYRYRALHRQGPE